MRHKANSSAGFTLMEVLIALAILAMGMTVLIGTQANSAMQSERANNMAVGAMLTRSKMLDIEADLLKEGFSEMRESSSGNFREEGFDNFRWEAVVEVVEISTDAEEALVASVIGELYGDDESEGALVGASAVTAFLPMIIAQIPQFINDVAKRARRVTLTVYWPMGSGEASFSVEQYVVDLDPTQPEQPEGLDVDAIDAVIQGGISP